MLFDAPLADHRRDGGTRRDPPDRPSTEADAPAAREELSPLAPHSMIQNVTGSTSGQIALIAHSSEQRSNTTPLLTTEEIERPRQDRASTTRTFLSDLANRMTVQQHCIRRQRSPPVAIRHRSGQSRRPRTGLRRRRTARRQPLRSWVHPSNGKSHPAHAHECEGAIRELPLYTRPVINSKNGPATAYAGTQIRSQRTPSTCSLAIGATPTRNPAVNGSCSSISFQIRACRSALELLRYAWSASTVMGWPNWGRVSGGPG